MHFEEDKVNPKDDINGNRSWDKIFDIISITILCTHKDQDVVKEVASCPKYNGKNDQQLTLKQSD